MVNGSIIIVLIMKQTAECIHGNMSHVLDEDFDRYF